MEWTPSLSHPGVVGRGRGLSRGSALPQAIPLEPVVTIAIPSTLGAGGSRDALSPGTQRGQSTVIDLDGVEEESERPSRSLNVLDTGFERSLPDAEMSASPPRQGSTPEGASWFALVRAAGASSPPCELLCPLLEEPGRARFVLRDLVEEELWHLADQVGVLAYQDLLQAEGGLVDALKTIRATRHGTSEDMLRLTSRLKWISDDKSRFRCEEHALHSHEEEARRWAADLARELESAQSAVGRERDRAITMEKGLEAACSALEVERASWESAEQQLSARTKEIASLKATLAQTTERLQELESTGEVKMLHC